MGVDVADGEDVPTVLPALDLTGIPLDDLLALPDSVLGHAVRHILNGQDQLTVCPFASAV